MRKSKVWKVGMLDIYSCDLRFCSRQGHLRDPSRGLPVEYSWGALAKISDNGHISTLFFPRVKGMEMVKATKNDVHQVWQILERLTSNVPGNTRMTIAGGRREEPKTTWEEAYKEGMNFFC